MEILESRGEDDDNKGDGRERVGQRDGRERDERKRDERERDGGDREENSGDGYDINYEAEDHSSKSITNTIVPRTDEEKLDWKNCEYCSKFRGKKKGRYEFHYNYCRRAVAFCRKCKKPSLTEAESESHVCYKMEKPTCPKCGKVFSERSALYEHNKIHLDLRRFACKSCPKKFLRAAHLRGHVMHVHTKERAWKCTLCDLAFPLRYELTRHMRKHEKATHLACDRCDLNFTSLKLLTRHNADVHDVRIKKEASYLDGGAAKNYARTTMRIPKIASSNAIANYGESLINFHSKRYTNISSSHGVPSTTTTEANTAIQILPLPGVEHSYVRILSNSGEHVVDNLIRTMIKVEEGNSTLTAGAFATTTKVTTPIKPPIQSTVQSIASISSMISHDDKVTYVVADSSNNDDDEDRTKLDGGGNDDVSSGVNADDVSSGVGVTYVGINGATFKLLHDGESTLVDPHDIGVEMTYEI